MGGFVCVAHVLAMLYNDGAQEETRRKVAHLVRPAHSAWSVLWQHSALGSGRFYKSLQGGRSVCEMHLNSCYLTKKKAEIGFYRNFVF